MVAKCLINLANLIEFGGKVSDELPKLDSKPSQVTFKNDHFSVAQQQSGKKECLVLISCSIFHFSFIPRRACN